LYAITILLELESNAIPVEVLPISAFSKVKEDPNVAADPV